ncbi:AP-1 complex subunit sigma-1, partial [Magnaporthiopsis poae ATCC 64411]
ILEQTFSDSSPRYLILLSRQGKVRLAKWFTTLIPKDKAKIVKDVTQLVLARRTRMCNFLEYKDTKIVYRRYASLFFIAGCSSDDNELITLEIIHRYVEQMDKYYGNVCELDIIFSFTKAYYILDEILLAGEMQESSKKNILRCIGQQDSLEDMEVSLKQLSFVTRQPRLGRRGTECQAGHARLDPPMTDPAPGTLPRSRTKLRGSCSTAHSVYYCHIHTGHLHSQYRYYLDPGNIEFMWSWYIELHSWVRFMANLDFSTLSFQQEQEMLVLTLKKSGFM